jgi:hypothetical protein
LAKPAFARSRPNTAKTAEAHPIGHFPHAIAKLGIAPIAGIDASAPVA